MVSGGQTNPFGRGVGMYKTFKSSEGLYSSVQYRHMHVKCVKIVVKMFMNGRQWLK